MFFMRIWKLPTYTPGADKYQNTFRHFLQIQMYVFFSQVIDFSLLNSWLLTKRIYIVTRMDINDIIYLHKG